MRRAWRMLVFAAATAGFMLICRARPDFSEHWTNAVIRPAARGLSALSARVPFAMLEVGIAALCTGLIVCSALSVAGAIKRRALWPVTKFLLRSSALALGLAATAALLWYPAYFVPRAPRAQARPEQLAALCEALIDELNALPPPNMSEQDALEAAVAAASHGMERPLSEGCVKIARLPVWMRALDAVGVYSPWSGEAVVSAELAPEAMLFTAVHELMHLRGAADEGEANIAAWTVCRRAGGEASRSAALWALRYAMDRVRAESDAWHALLGRMNAETLEGFAAVNGFAPLDARPGVLVQLLGLGEATASYAALVDMLAAEM